MQLSTKSLTRGAAGEGEVRGPNGVGNPDAGVGAIPPSIDRALWTSSFDAVSATGGSTSTLHITNGLKDV